jgi:hypothetical protein
MILNWIIDKDYALMNLFTERRYLQRQCITRLFIFEVLCCLSLFNSYVIRSNSMRYVDLEVENTHYDETKKMPPITKT